MDPIVNLLHKIRTCDRRGNFTYPDAEVLQDLRATIEEERREATELERHRCLGLAQAYRDRDNIVIGIHAGDIAPIMQDRL